MIYRLQKEDDRSGPSRKKLQSFTIYLPHSEKSFMANIHSLIIWGRNIIMLFSNRVSYAKDAMWKE